METMNDVKSESPNKSRTIINGIPDDVMKWLDARADKNFRSRNGEILAILTYTMKADEGTLPGLGVAETIGGEA